MFTFLTGTTDVYTTIGQAFITGIGTMVDGITAMVGDILPVGMVLIGISLAIGWGRKLVKSLGKG